MVGIIPRFMVDKGRAHESLTELRIVSTMHERKALMADLADGFVALPGGVGTLEEFCEAEQTILKIVTHVFSERHCRIYRPPVFQYILENSICDGDVACLPSRCDRSCYFFWHERWMETP